LVLESGISNIHEVASGVSPRGLIMSANPSIYYIETDLPDMLRQKRAILDEVSQFTGVILPPNLHFAEMNALHYEAFEAVAGMFPPGPIAICNEGLLAYFSHDEKRTMGKIIHDILVERGGVWITPDIFTKADLPKVQPTQPNEHVEKTLSEIAQQTERRYSDCAFDDLEHAHRFADSLGLVGSVTTIGAIAGHVASASMGLDQEYVRRQLSFPIWTLRVK
jgi:O-methyltransferase involved in polyketide biosynthesis